MPQLETARTWDLICTLLRPGHSKYVRQVLNARMAALGARDLFELVAMEMDYNARGLPHRDNWDPAIVNAGITVELLGLDDVPPLQLQLNSTNQAWAARVVTSPNEEHFGNFPTIAEADAFYRAVVGLDDAAQATRVLVNGETRCRTIIDGHIVPALAGSPL
jgi:hypothetical protein